jgi:hypothetical protein
MPDKHLPGVEGLTIPKELSLVVVWPSGKGLAGGEIKAQSRVTEFLRKAADATLTKLREADERAYNPDMQLEPEESVRVQDPDLIARSPLKEILLSSQPLPVLNAQLLPKRQILLYAVTFLADKQRFAFVRKTSPRHGVRKGSLLGLLGDTLVAVDEPAFALEPEFDMIVTKSGVLSASQNAFELLFKDTELVLAQVPSWISSISDCLPIAGNGRDQLAELARRDSRVRRRLHAISASGHLVTVGIAEIRAYLNQQGLDEAAYIEDEELLVEEAGAHALLKVLSEDLFIGGLSGRPYQSDRKSPRH